MRSPDDLDSASERRKRISLVPEVEKLLRQLQGRIRAKPKGNPISFTPDDRRIVVNVRNAIADDLRYEHIADSASIVDTFIQECHVNRTGQLVGAFEANNAKEPERHVCFIGIDYLKVDAAIEVLEMRLIPPDSAEIPRMPAPDRFDFPPTTMAVAVVETLGTNRNRMLKERRIQLHTYSEFFGSC
jgi:hypothetical protein